MNHKPKELRRFYEPLSTICALYEQMPDAKNPILTEGHGLGIRQRRRDFVNAIAYLGAFKEDCDLAVAVSKDDYGCAVVKIAGSRDIDQDVIPFLEDLLKLVTKSTSERPSHDAKQSILSLLSEYVMKFHNKSIFERYGELLRDIAPICLRMMMDESQKAGGMTAIYV